jgi:hypothetical protein
VRLRGLKSQFRKAQPKDHRPAVLRCGLPQERTAPRTRHAQDARFPCCVPRRRKHLLAVRRTRSCARGTQQGKHESQSKRALVAEFEAEDSQTCCAEFDCFCSASLLDDRGQKPIGQILPHALFASAPHGLTASGMRAADQPRRLVPVMPRDARLPCCVPRRRKHLLAVRRTRSCARGTQQGKHESQGERALVAEVEAEDSQTCCVEERLFLCLRVLNGDRRPRTGGQMHSAVSGSHTGHRASQRVGYERPTQSQQRLVD